MISTSGMIARVRFILLVISYSVIWVTVRQHSPGGSSKALSTCSAHFTVVTLFFGPCIFIYVWPFTNFPIDKVLSVFYTIFTPLLNPVIYTLRNKDVKGSMRKLSSRVLKYSKTDHSPWFAFSHTKMSIYPLLFVGQQRHASARNHTVHGRTVFIISLSSYWVLVISRVPHTA